MSRGKGGDRENAEAGHGEAGTAAQEIMWEGEGGSE